MVGWWLTMGAKLTRLRSWRIRTFYRGIRERWPLVWWRRFVRQVWYERRTVLAQVNRMHFDIDLRVRRLRRCHGEAGMIRAMCRMHNAAMARMRWGNEEAYRRQAEAAP